MKINGRYKIKTFKDGKLVRETDWIKNLVVSNNNNGVNLFIQRLAGLTDYDLAVTELQLGTGDNPPTNADTGLQTKVVENIDIASFEKTVTKVTFNFFIADAETPNNTYKEVGIFCGTQLLARSLILPTYTKSTGEDTTVDYEIEITNT